MELPVLKFSDGGLQLFRGLVCYDLCSEQGWKFVFVDNLHTLCHEQALSILRQCYLLFAEGLSVPYWQGVAMP